MSGTLERAKYIYNPLTDDQFSRLYAALCKCPTISDDGKRDILFSRLPDEIRDNTVRNPALAFDVLSILQTCLNYKNGFARLFFWLNQFDKDSTALAELSNTIFDIIGKGVVPKIQRDRLLEDLPFDLLPADQMMELYRMSLPRLWNRRNESPALAAILEELAEIPPQDGLIPYPLLAFVVRMESRIDEQDIKNIIEDWLSETASLLPLSEQDLQVLRIAVNDNTPSEAVEPYLLIELLPADWNGKLFSVKAWLWRDKDDVETMETGDDPISKEGFKVMLDNLLRDSAQKLSEAAADLTLEFLLPREMFCWDFDQWYIKGTSKFSMRAGTKHPVVVRSNERIGLKGEVAGYWKKKWQRFLKGPLSIFWILNPSADERLNARMTMEEDLYCLGLTFAPPEKPCEDDILEMAVYAGIPIALWVRQGYTSLDKLKEEIEALLRSTLERNELKTLPKLIQKMRYDAFMNNNQMDVCNHLSLLWDDPDRLPPIDKYRGTQRARV